MSTFTDAQRKLVTLYKSFGQEHLFDASIPEETQKKLIQQLEDITAKLPAVGEENPLQSYLERARTLLAASAEGLNPYEGFKVEIPTGVDLPLNLKDSDFLTYEALGMKNILSTGFVLVAGGLGERLGYDGIKLELPVDLASMKTHLQWYIENIIAYKGISGKSIPLAIMTSDDTYTKTIALLEKNNYYGLPAEDVTIINQAKVPALIDNAAHVALERDSEGKVIGVDTKPHGHGDVHALMKPVLEKWTKLYDTKYVAFIQDTNSLIFNAIPATLGVSVKNGFAMNTVAVDRKPGEAVGGLAKLVKEDGTELTINVEYNQLAPLLKANGQTEATDANGNSLFPGNTNSFIVEASTYLNVLERTGGILAEFVNPKYADETKTVFKSSARLECMMQDLPKAFPASAKVGFTKFERWMVFSAVKNSVKDAAAKQKAGLYPECAFSAEADRYACYTEILKRAVLHSNGKFEAEAPIEETFFDVTYPLGPKVVIFPSFGNTVGEIIRRVAGAEITIKSSEPLGNSALILEGNAQIVRINIDGGVFHVSAGPRAVEDVKNAFVFFVDEPEPIQNKGWFVEPTVGSQITARHLPPHLRVRGYVMHKAESRVLHNQFDLLNNKNNQKCCW